jgi:hypothetical protein
LSQIGSQKITADGVIGGSGKPIRLYAALVKSGASAAAPILYDGTSNSGTEYDTCTCATVSVVNRFYYPGGLLFPDGLYIDIDANTTYVTCIYSQES